MKLKTRNARHGRQRNNRFRSIENLEPRIVLDSTVVINEIMYNPAGNEDVEWIELYNQLRVDMDISEWVLDGAVRYEFPDQTVVPGRGHLLVAANPSELSSQNAAFEGSLGPWEGRLDNAGEEILLYNNDGRLMNSVDYGDNGDWPVAPDGGGVSLAKADQLSASHIAANWTFSQRLGGTPGLDNFIRPGTYIFTELSSETTPLKATVPVDGSMGLDWTQPGFDDAAWLTGLPGVGHDSSRAPTYTSHLGLNLDAPPNDQAPMPIEDVNGSVYIRQTFHVAAGNSFDTLQLQMKYDDGFIAYLNGTEVMRANAPDDATWDSLATSSNRDTNAVIYESFSLQDHAHLLQEGENLLAIHGMNTTLSSNDSLFSPLVVGGELVLPVEEYALKINEIAPAADPNFFVEVINTGDEPIDLANFSLVNRGATETTYTFAAGLLNPGEVRSVTANQLGFTSANDDFVGIYTTDETQLTDARRVTRRLRGRSEAHDGRWLYPDVATPGTANQFAFNDDIVINEIMYNPHPLLSVSDIPPQYEFTRLLSFDSQWRYNASGAKLPTDWAQATYAVDGQAWQEGQGLLGAESSSLPEPLVTEFPRPSTNDPRFATYYFQTEFELTADEFANADVMELSHIIDDAAIIYVNGQEVHRFNLPAEVDADTLADRSVTNADLTTGIAIPANVLQVGTNVISAEVHLRTLGDSDIVFGAEIQAGRQVSELIPGRDYRERDDEEWIELYNKGDAAVDLTGWSIREGISFDFPEGTMLGAGEYLLIASDADRLREIYPELPIVGTFSGQLSNHDDLLLLRDAADNPADEVHYFEGGQWPEYADGGGVSLELMHPDADNSKGAVWAASDDSAESEWTTHTFRGTTQLDIYGRALFDEFLFGLLEPGEFLIDDVEVVKDPDGQAIPLMQNGTFDTDTLGESPEKWRLIGNHSGVVVVDPTDPTNQALHVTAVGAMAHVHDHVETTFANREDLDDGVEYEISFRTKWIAGSSQLNNRLWFNRLSNTVKMHVTERSGTPGAVNSRLQDNVGPVYSDLHHTPIVPAENEPFTVRVRAEDIDGVNSAQLNWRLDRQEWNTVAMTQDASGHFQAEIPGQSEGDIIQFYVEATDGRGATSMFPADGPDSRALVQVDDGRGPNTAIDSFRMIMTDPDNDEMYRNTNLMSNAYRGITLVHNGDTVFYDVEARFIGSRFVRPNSGYKIKMNPEQPFYGVHDSIRFDIDGLREIVIKQMINRTGGTKASQYDDIGYLIAPNRGHSHEFLLQLARYENLYLNEQFENGSDGTKFEVDDVTVPSGGSFEGLKTGTEVNTGQDIGGTGNSWVDQRANPEFYRAHILIKSNRAKDNFDAIARLGQAIHLDGDELFEATNEVMDVDLWMRHYAHQSFLGAWDTYGFGRPKNLRLYVRPADDKIIPLWWDCDRCPMDRAIKQNVSVSRLDEIRNIPHNLRIYWGHMLDFMNTSFTEDYVARWAAHYSQLTAGRSHGAEGDFNEIVTKMRTRVPQAMNDLERDIPRVDFDITTNGGDDLQVGQPTITLEGKGWVDIRNLKLDGTTLQDVFWPEEDVWQVTVPLATGVNALTLEAIDYRGNLIATDTINVTNTLGAGVVDAVRVTEVNYNPADPSDALVARGFDSSDDFEFVELRNISDSTISLVGVTLDRLTGETGDEGIEYDFSQGAITQLAPGERLVVVEDIAAFEARYGTSMPVAGQWSGGLRNSSETITVSANGVPFHQFTYSDEWYPETDGNGSSLEIIDDTSELATWNTPAAWKASLVPNGSPGIGTRVPGDSNGDGKFSSEDLVLALQAGEYEDGVENNSTFEEGDWNGDGEFDTRDFVFAFVYGAYESDQPAAALAQRNNVASEIQIDSAENIPKRRLEQSTSIDRIFDELGNVDDAEFEDQDSKDIESLLDDDALIASERR